MTTFTTFRRLSDLLRVAAAHARELPPGGSTRDRALAIARRVYRDPEFELQGQKRFLIEAVLKNGSSCPAVYTVAPDLALAAFVSMGKHRGGIPGPLPPMFDEPWLLEIEGDERSRLVLHATSVGGIERRGEVALYWLDYLLPPQVPRPSDMIRRAEWTPKREPSGIEQRRGCVRQALGTFIHDGFGSAELDPRLAAIMACFTASLAGFVKGQYGDVVRVEERELPPWVDAMTGAGVVRLPALGLRIRHLAVRPNSWVDTTVGPNSALLHEQILDTVGVIRPSKR